TYDPPQPGAASRGNGERLQDRIAGELQAPKQKRLRSLRRAPVCAGSAPTETERSRTAQADVVSQTAEPTPRQQEMDGHVPAAGKIPSRAGAQDPSALPLGRPEPVQTGIPPSRTDCAERRSSRTSSSKAASTR